MITLRLRSSWESLTMQIPTKSQTRFREELYVTVSEIIIHSNISPFLIG